MLLRRRDVRGRRLWQGGTLLPAGMALLLLPLLSGCYLVNQGAGFISYQLKAQSLERSARRSPEYRPLFTESEAIRSFGAEFFGLEASGNYTTFVEIDRDYLVSVVSAARPASFERKLWRFPVVGSVPYRGYYSENGAHRLARQLREEGWETVVRRVNAFSSLGFFPDPLYSFMAGYHPERLANLLLHEMTHATLWIPDEVPLNEAMATFVGDRGALAYLAYRYGEGSERYREGVVRQQERRRFVSFMRQLAGRLELLYAEPLEEAEILRRKEEIIREEQQRFAENYDDWFSTDRYRFLPGMEINNAYVDLFRTYNDELPLFEQLYQTVNGDMGRFFDALRDIEAAEDPTLRLRELLATGRG
ncbi:MAG: aminopeptidase [Alkalispirochaetaceae bacterium]